MLRTYRPSDTITASSTPPGEGAIAVIRVSGPDAFSIALKIFSGPVQSYKSHTAHYGKILDREGKAIDSVLLLVMKGPHSYTGEDTVEISCHGNRLIVRRILERICEAGARPAQPGEFSLQAFLNRKLDLAQAEAVQQLIASKSEIALEMAEKQLAGHLSQQIKAFQTELTSIAAILEAWVDFPEEGLEFSRFEDLIERLTLARDKMKRLANTFHEGKRIHEGLSLCLAGAPNVGKSSLMNALLGKERAIVSSIPGTTRDVLEEDLHLAGLSFRLMDTAGMRETSEAIEQEGIRRAQCAMKEADLVLLLLDASRPLQKEDFDLLQRAPQAKTLIVWNKVDLQVPPNSIDGIPISAKQRIGFERLKEAIDRMVWHAGPLGKEEVAITTLRHQQALEQAMQAVEKVIEGLIHQVSAELVASDMRHALNELGTIIGTNVTEDILSSIFSQFCLGK